MRYCEYDGGLGDRGLHVEPCGEPATGKWWEKWYCEDHLESMEAHAGLVDALNELAREGERGGQ